MKMTRILLLIALFAVPAGAAQQPAVDPSASVNEKPRFLPVIVPAGPKDETKRINGLSTRSWTTVVGWQPGASAFPNETTHEEGLYLFSAGVAPER